MIVLHCIDTYLPVTCLWLQNQIVFNKAFSHKVLTNKRENKDVFDLPTREIYEIPYFFLKNKMYYNEKGKEKIMNILRNGIKPFDSLIYNNIKKKVGKFDIVHAHFGTNGMGLLSFKNSANIPMVTSFYGHDILKVVQKNKGLYDKMFDECELFLVEGSNAKKVFVDAGFDGNKIHSRIISWKIKA